MGFSWQEYYCGLPFTSPGDLPNPGIEPRSPSLQANALSSEPPGKTVYTLMPPRCIYPAQTPPLNACCTSLMSPLGHQMVIWCQHPKWAAVHHSQWMTALLSNCSNPWPQFLSITPHPWSFSQFCWLYLQNRSRLWTLLTTSTTVSFVPAASCLSWFVKSFTAKLPLLPLPLKVNFLLFKMGLFFFIER